MCGAAAWALSASMLSHFSITRKVSSPHFLGHFRANVPAVRAEMPEDLLALAGLGGDDRDDVDHAFSFLISPLWTSFSRSWKPPTSTPLTKIIGKVGQPVHIFSARRLRHSPM